jgi:hypothetical protein
MTGVTSGAGTAFPSGAPVFTPVFSWACIKYNCTRRDWRYQGGNQNPYIEEQPTQWPWEKVQKDKQRSTKHTHKTKDRVTGTPLKTGVNTGAGSYWTKGSSSLSWSHHFENLTVMEYLCHKWPRICSTCCKHFPVFSWFLTNNRAFNFEV